MTNFKKSDIIFGAVAIVDAIIAVSSLSLSCPSINDESLSAGTQLFSQIITPYGTFTVRSVTCDDELRGIPYCGMVDGESESPPEIPEGLTVTDTHTFALTDGNVYSVYIYSDGTASEAWIIGQKIIHSPQLDEEGNRIPLAKPD
jgi:hypothetical protein